MFKHASLLAPVLALTGFAASVTAQSCGDHLYTVSYGAELRTVDPLTGATLSSVALTETAVPLVLNGCRGMAIHPTTGDVFVLAEYGGGGLGGRYLASLDIAAGTTTSVGHLGDAVTEVGSWMADITFAPDGTLYGIIGNGGIDPETLYTIDTTTAVVTQVMVFPVASGSDGESLAFHGQTGELFRASGTTLAFESIDLMTQTITSIGVTGHQYDEGMELVNLGDGNFLWTSVGQEFGIINSMGECRVLGTMDHYAMGMGYVQGASNVPFHRQYGYGCQAATSSGRSGWLLGTGCPAPGSTFTIHHMNGNPNQVSVLAVGFGTTAAPVALLPCDLQIFPLLTSFFFLSDANGDFSMSVAVPSNPGIGPFNLFFQAGQIDGGGNIVLTNANQTGIY